MSKIFTCTLSTSSLDVTLSGVTNINNSDRLFVGLFVYSKATKVCTKIDKIVDISTIRLTDFPVKSGIYDVTFSDIPPYRKLELCESLHDVQTIINNYGKWVKLQFRNESNITRDEINDIATRRRNSGAVLLKAHPVQYNPTEAQTEKAGFVEAHDVIIWLSRQDFISNNLEFIDIDLIRTTVMINDITYKVNNKNQVSQLGDDYLYYTLGLRKI